MFMASYKVVGANTLDIGNLERYMKLGAPQGKIVRGLIVYWIQIIGIRRIHETCADDSRFTKSILPRKSN